jgi:hypothetical protein
MNGHSFKLYFCMFERSQVKHNSLDCHNVFWKYFPLIVKFTCSRLTQISFFCVCSKHSNLENIQSLFSYMSFFIPNVHHSFFKLKKILILMIRRAKGLELMNFFFITHLSTFDSKCF